MTGRRLTAALVALTALFIIVVVLGQVVLRPVDAVGTPSQSWFRVVEDVFPPRILTPAEIRRGGPTCLQGQTLVVPVGGGCTFIVPDGVHVVLFRRVTTSAAMMVTVSQTADLTQTVDTGQPGADPFDPLTLRFAAVHDGTTVTFYGCRGPGACRLGVGR